MHHTSFANIIVKREIADLLYIFKCIKGYYDAPWSNNVEILNRSNLRSGNAGHVLRMLSC